MFNPSVDSGEYSCWQIFRCCSKICLGQAVLCLLLSMAHVRVFEHHIVTKGQTLSACCRFGAPVYMSSLASTWAMWPRSHAWHWTATSCCPAVRTALCGCGILCQLSGRHTTLDGHCFCQPSLLMAMSTHCIAAIRASRYGLQLYPNSFHTQADAHYQPPVM